MAQSKLTTFFTCESDKADDQPSSSENQAISQAADQPSSVCQNPQPTSQFVPPRGYKFPPRTFGASVKKKQRSCFIGWFEKHPWLHYEATTDVVLCWICYNARKQGLKIFEKRAEDAFRTSGFANWNDGGRVIKRHEVSISHMEAVTALERNNSKENMKIDEILDKSLQQNKLDNRYILLAVIDALKFLSRQGLATRGACEANDESSSQEPNSNLWQLLLSLGERDERLGALLKRRITYTSPNVQNELLCLMSDNILTHLLSIIKAADYYSLMIDETPDVSGSEQAVICFRIVTADFDVHEYPLGLYHVPGTSAAVLFKMIKDVLLRFQIPLASCRGQCYDGASAMSGKRNGLKTIMLKENPKAIYVHCYAHSLQLAVQDSVRQSKTMSDVFDLCSEVARLIRQSTKRTAALKKLKEEINEPSIGIRALCPTRWTVRARAIDGIISNYGQLLELFMDVSDITEPELKSRIRGTHKTLTDFRTYFGLRLAHVIFLLTDTLSSGLQSPKLSCADGSDMAKAVLAKLKELRSDDGFAKLYADVMESSKKLNLEEKEPPRIRRVPERFEDGSRSTYHVDASSEDACRREYFCALDNTIAALADRFNQDDVDVYLKLTGLVRNAIKGDTCEIDEELGQMYKDDFDAELLQAQLSLIKYQVGDIKIESVGDFADWFRESESRHFLGEVEKLLKLILTLPATNASSERTFSALKRLKTYLRSSMSQKRLNACMILHIYKELQNHICPNKVIQEFVSVHIDRKHKISLV